MHVCRPQSTERVTGERTLDAEEYAAALAGPREATVAATCSFDDTDQRRFMLHVETPDGRAVHEDIDHNNPRRRPTRKNLDIAYQALDGLAHS